MRVLTICGASRGRYGFPWRIDGPRGIKRWMNEAYRPVKPPLMVACEHSRHFLNVRGNRKRYPRAECYVQGWRLTPEELRAAIRDWDILSLEMPPLILCSACARAERKARTVSR